MTMEAQQDAAVRRQQIEQSLETTYRQRLLTPFAQAVREYQLIQPQDRIAVCISGGKDSMLMAKLFQAFQQRSAMPFSVEYLVMDPGYRPENRQAIEENARLLGVPLTIFETEIFDTVYGREKNPCYLCARMRRGHLYQQAQARGCNKIALGHHYDDVIETTLMGMLYGGQIQTMPPKLHSAHYPGMELIRPLYFIREKDIQAWRDRNGLRFLQCACRFTEDPAACDAAGRTLSKRLEMKRLIAQMKKTNPAVEANIFRSMENVCLDTVLGYKQNGRFHSFLERYEETQE